MAVAVATRKKKAVVVHVPYAPFQPKQFAVDEKLVGTSRLQTVKRLLNPGELGRVRVAVNRLLGA